MAEALTVSVVALNVALRDRNRADPGRTRNRAERHERRRRL